MKRHDIILNLQSNVWTWKLFYVLTFVRTFNKYISCLSILLVTFSLVLSMNWSQFAVRVIFLIKVFFICLSKMSKIKVMLDEAKAFSHILCNWYMAVSDKCIIEKPIKQQPFYAILECRHLHGLIASSYILYVKEIFITKKISTIFGYNPSMKQYRAIDTIKFCSQISFNWRFLFFSSVRLGWSFIIVT